MPLRDACEGFGVWQAFATSVPISSTGTRTHAALTGLAVLGAGPDVAKCRKSMLHLEIFPLRWGR